MATAPVVSSSAPLIAITATVVGVMANLALYFAAHVFWPQGLNGAAALVSMLVALFALAALLRFKVGVLPLIGTCALLGVIRSVVL